MFNNVWKSCFLPKLKWNAFFRILKTLIILVNNKRFIISSNKTFFFQTKTLFQNFIPPHKNIFMTFLNKEKSIFDFLLKKLIRKIMFRLFNFRWHNTALSNYLFLSYERIFEPFRKVKSQVNVTRIFTVKCQNFLVWNNKFN